MRTVVLRANEETRQQGKIPEGGLYTNDKKKIKDVKRSVVEEFGESLEDVHANFMNEMTRKQAAQDRADLGLAEGEELPDEESDLNSEYNETLIKK